MSDFTYFECPTCGFSVVLPTSAGTEKYCGVCAEDNGRDVRMDPRPAKDGDKPEGYDARRSAAT